MVEFIPRGPHLWDLVKEHRISPETINPPAEKIVSIFNSIEALLNKANGRQVFLLHVPRGATPIVEGIKYAWRKTHGNTKIPFKVLLIPTSRENVSPAEAKTVFKEKLQEIPDKSIVVYVDEAVTGTNASQNIEDMAKILRQKKCELHSHLMISRRGIYMNLDARKRIQSQRLYKGSNTSFHAVSELLPWTDNSKSLGQNWGLNYKFPFDLVMQACGTGFGVKRDVKRFRSAFNLHYRALLTQAEDNRFHLLNFSSKDYEKYYNSRTELVMIALKNAIKSSGFDKKFSVEFEGRKMLVQGTAIEIPLLEEHLTDTHPNHEIKRGRAAYKHHLVPDPNRLIVFLHSGEYVKRGRGRNVQSHQRDSYRLMKALKSRIGLEIHRQMHPRRRK